MNRRSQLAQALDHPIFFVFIMAFALLPVFALITWAAKAADLPGLAALAQHP